MEDYTQEITNAEARMRVVALVIVLFIVSILASGSPPVNPAPFDLHALASSIKAFTSFSSFNSRSFANITSRFFFCSDNGQ